MNTLITTPSEVGQTVWVNFLQAGKIGPARIQAVRKTANRISYDLSIKVGDNSFSKISDVDSVFILTEDEWTELNADTWDWIPTDKDVAYEVLSRYSSTTRALNLARKGAFVDGVKWMIERSKM